MSAWNPASGVSYVGVRDLPASLRFLSTRVSNVASMFAVLLVFCLYILASESSFFSYSPSLTNVQSKRPPSAPRLQPWEVDQGYHDEDEKETTVVAVVDVDDHGCDGNMEPGALDKSRPLLLDESNGCGPWESNIGGHPDEDHVNRQIVIAHVVAETLGAKGLTNVETEEDDLSTAIIQEEEAKFAAGDTTAGTQADASAVAEEGREKQEVAAEEHSGSREPSASAETKEESVVSTQGEASAAAKEVMPPGCEGKLIYMYHLPDRFNAHYLLDCAQSDTCESYSNSGMGQLARPKAPAKTSQASTRLKPPHAWFETASSSLEITFHARMKEHACLTSAPEKASLFYIPFYASLALRPVPNQKDGEGRDGEGAALVDWLQQQHPWYNRHYGMDHLLVLSRPVSHFAQGVMSGVRESNLMGLWHMKNVMVVGVEGNPHPALWNTFSIPYPSFFHPHSDTDVDVWQTYVLRVKRKRRIAFGVSGGRLRAPLNRALKSMCRDPAAGCRSFTCVEGACAEPRTAMWNFIKSDFCLLLPGATPTSRGLFDCMLAGTIPVTFDEHTALDYTWHFPSEASTFMVFVPGSEVLKDNGTALLAKLWAFTDEEVSSMRAKVVSLIPRIVYAAPGHNVTKHKDAFDVAVDNILQKLQGRVS